MEPRDFTCKNFIFRLLNLNPGHRKLEMGLTVPFDFSVRNLSFSDMALLISCHKIFRNLLAQCLCQKYKRFYYQIRLQGTTDNVTTYVHRKTNNSQKSICFPKFRKVLRKWMFLDPLPVASESVTSDTVYIQTSLSHLILSLFQCTVHDLNGLGGQYEILKVVSEVRVQIILLFTKSM